MSTQSSDIIIQKEIMQVRLSCTEEFIGGIVIRLLYSNANEPDYMILL